MSVQGYLRILKRSGEGGSLFPVKGSCRIGRSSQCDVRIMLPDIAPVHCIITGDEHGQGLVENKCLTKPTLVNGVPMAKNPVDLAHYDLITLADRTLRWEYLQNSPFFVMRAEGVHMSHLGSKDISGRMVTVPLSALQKSPTAHLTTPKNARGRKSVVTPSRNPITPLSSRKSNITPSRNPITPLSSRKSNALVAVVSPTRRNKEIQSPPSVEPDLSDLKPQPKKRVSLPIKKNITPLKSNNRRTLHEMPTVPTKSSPKRLHVIKSDTSPLDRPITGGGKSKKLKDIKIISKPTSTPLRKSTGARRSVSVKPLTPRPVARKSMPALLVGLAHNASDKGSSASSPSDRKSKSWKISDIRRTSLSPATTSLSGRKSKSWRTSDVQSTSISSATKAPKNRHSTSSVQSAETNTRQKGVRTPRKSSGVSSPRKSLKSPQAKNLKRTPGSSKVVAKKEFKTLIPRLVPPATKRKFEDDLVSAERAAKRMKMVKSPKSPDKKKMAAILQCHGKSPHNAMKIRKPLFSEVLKTSIARKKVPKHQNLGKSRAAPTKKRPVTTTLKLTTVVPKSFRFNSTGHADSPETIIIRKGNQLPITNVFKSPLSAARKSPSDRSVSLQSTSGLRSSFTTTPILKKKSLASFDIPTSSTPSRKSVHFSTTNSTSDDAKSPRKGRLSLVEKSLSFDYDTQDKGVLSRNAGPSINTPMKLIEERKQFQDSQSELAPKQTSRKSGARRSLASPEERRGFLPESSNSETPKMDMTGREITMRSNGRKSVVGTPSSARKITPERSSGGVERDRSAKKSLTRRLSPSEKHISSDSEFSDERINRKSGVRKSLVSSAETRQELSAAKSIASSDSETPTRKVSRRSGVRKSLISPGEHLSAPSPVEITTSDSETPNKITPRRSGARKSIVTSVESLSTLSDVEITTSDSETSNKMSRRSGARKSLVAPVEPVTALSPVEFTTSDSENTDKITSRRSSSRKSLVAPVEPKSALSPVEKITLDSETPNKMPRRSASRKSLVAPVEPSYVQSPIEITLDSKTPNRISRKSGARKSLIAPVSALSPGELTTSDSENTDKTTSRRSGARKSLVAPVEPKSAVSPVEKITSDSETSNKMSRRSGSRKSLVAPVEPRSSLSPVEIISDSETPNNMSRRSGARKSIGAPGEPKGALSPVEILSDSESPNKTSRRSGARKSLIAPVSALSPGELTTSDSENTDKTTSRRSGARKSLVAPVEPKSAASPVEKITSDSETSNKMSRRSGSRKSLVAPVEPRSSLSPVEIISDSETPINMSRRSGARKSIGAPGEPKGALSPVEILSDSESPNKTSRRSGARKSLNAPVETLSVPSPAGITTSDSETLDKITSRKSGTRKSFITPVEPLCPQSPGEITSDSDTPNKMSRRSGAKKSFVVPVEPISAPSSVEKITSDSETPNKMSSRSGARRSIVAPGEPSSALMHIEITSDSETPNKMSRRSGARKSILSPVKRVSTPLPVEKLYSETPNKIASRRSGARTSLVPPNVPRLGFVSKAALSDSETPEKIAPTRLSSRNSLVLPVEPRHSISAAAESETSEKIQSRSGAKKGHVRLSASDSESTETIQHRRSGARRSFVTRVDRSVENMTAVGADTPKEKLTRRSFVNKSIILPVESHSSSDTESQVEVPFRSSSRKSIKYSPIREPGDLTDSVSSSGKHSKSGKSFRSSIQLKFADLNTLSSPKSSSKRQSRRSSLLFKKNKISTPMKVSSKSVSPLMRSGKLQQENDFISLSSSVRCEASTSRVLGISLTESELSLLVSPKSSASSPHSSRKRSIDMLSDEEEFPSSKRRSTSVNSISAVFDGSASTSFDFSAYKTPSIEQELSVSPLSATSNAGLRTSLRKRLAIDERLSKASLHRSSSKGGSPRVSGVKRLLKTPRTQLSPRNDLTRVQGIRKLFKTPSLQQSPKNDLTNIQGVGKLLRTPRPQQSPKNDLSDVRGVKQLLGSPRLQRSPKNDLSDVRGVKKLLGSPRLRQSPKNDLSDVRGVKQLLGSPRLRRSPKNDLSDVRGVKKLLGSPRLRQSPKNDLSDVRGVKKLLGSPRLRRSPKNDLSDVRGVKKLLGSPRLRQSPKNDLSDVRGVKNLLSSPRLQQSPKNDLSDVRGVKKLFSSPRLQRSPKNDLTRIEGVRELFKNSSISRTSGSTSTDSVDVTDLKQLFNSSPKSSSASFENSSEVSGARQRGRRAEIGQNHSAARRRPDVETRPDSSTVEERESSVRAASATKTKKGRGKTSSNTKSQSPIASIGAAETEDSTVPEETQIAPPVKTRRGKATASVIQLATPETFSPKGEGMLDVEDSSGASISRTRRAAGGKRKVQPEMTSPRKTRGKAAAKETSTTKLISDQEDLNISGKKTKARSNKIVFNSPVKQGEVNAETTNLENQRVTEITSAQKKRGRTASKPDDQSAQESLPKTRRGRAAAERVDMDAETSKVSTAKSRVQKRQKEVSAELESNTAEESSPEKPRMTRRGGAASKREVQVARKTVSKSQEDKIRGRVANKFESLAAGEPVLEALDNMNKESAAANDVQISEKSVLKSPDKKGKRGIPMNHESQVTGEPVAQTPDRRKRGRIGANQDAEKVVPGTPDQKRRGRAAAQIDMVQEAKKSVSKSPEQRKRGKTLVNLESESTSDSTSDTSKRRGRAGAGPITREPSKSPEQKRTRRGEAKLEIQPTEAPTSGQKRRGRKAKPESETTMESTLNSSNQMRRGRRAAVAVGLKSQSTDESTPEISLQQERRLSAELELPRPKRRGRVAAEVESQLPEVPNSSDRTRPGRTAAKSESQTSAKQKKQKGEASLESQPIIGSPNKRKLGRAAADSEAHSVDILPSPPKRTKRGRVAAEVDSMPAGNSPEKLAGKQTVPPKVSKQNKSSSTKKGKRTSSDSQSPERVLGAASNQKSRRGRTVAEVAMKTKVKSPSPRKTRSRK